MPLKKKLNIEAVVLADILRDLLGILEVVFEECLLGLNLALLLLCALTTRGSMTWIYLA